MHFFLHVATAALFASELVLVAAQGAQCFSLKTSTACGEFSDFSILPDTGVPQRFRDIATFDQYVLKTIGTNLDFQKFFKSRYSCPTWDGTGLRYPRSFFCGFLVDASLQLGCAKPAAGKPLCKTTADETVASYQSIFSNASFCPVGTPHTLDAQTTGYASNLTTADGCVVAVQSELSMCGFALKTEAATYCGVPANAGSACCTSAIAAGNVLASASVSSVSTNPSSSSVSPSASNVATDQSSADSRSSNSGVSISEGMRPIVIGASAAGVAIIAATILAIVFLRKRKTKSKALEPNFSETVQVAETMQVIYDYAANLFDELELHIGDHIIVKCKFDDGWAFGFNMSTKQEGSFPMACISPIQASHDSLPPLPTDVFNDRINQRASSLYAPSQAIQY
ncbi:hypothetical protein BATDEDRAFT_91681 [Batrachochytrium dendrobatidis JAM81]|uniref:SH3 domain-containing protein n=2 Tax=Batrachochytrium dendrobatidis TaxID=109871 RepID=F4PBJ9_BATDJ|nr:uncharacterized protein BATDEDRAFT_91681 [Batrachochytrium dendrobatidis JAM81]EGF77335.1 hypothetical protein BATDEDRAFT_91681 [Batrachochytrium dendrobatidis JAM81]KAJ8327623.1 hypothetical protein O5D80_003972 [Batrachochytrium dendrobatidis]KAK5669256.1 hypothetical protein QVD99_003664 [Batrachochytrium dendrobatidis]OAJ37787.1 hypothetical protein BDEG_21779 [Batrachochytrium dendrobatidis JEL423]|eukprot:XP_006682044.1 hypothetical protein BATDEDRAFT_91681 [Batrachochytrium dendrobatidis JAM81]